MASGVSHSDGKPAVQAYVELNKNGFYGGLWLSKVDYKNSDDIAVDLFLGYRARIDDKLLIDIGYAHYLYDDSGECCGDLKLLTVYRVVNNLGLEGYVAYNHRTKKLNRRAGVVYAPTKKINLSSRYGKSGGTGNNYWSVGGSYALTKHVSVAVRYHGADGGNEGLVVNLALATTQSSIARLLAGQFGR